MEYKKEFKYFTIFDVEKEQQYLREMHKHGWKFTNVTGIGTYHFKECEPEDVVYQLDYNKDGLAHKEEYVQMFSDFGWEYLMDFFGFSYFRKPASEMNGNEEIFCDDRSRLDMMERVFKGRMQPLFVMFLFAPAFLHSLIYSHNYVMTTVYVLCFIVYIVFFIKFGMQYFKYKK